MPDTGAPWNLPYPSPSDLVRDAPQAFEDLAEAVADGLDNAGAIAKFEYVTDTTNRSSTAGDWADAGISIDFTPTAADSLLLVQWSGNAEAGRNSGTFRDRIIILRLVEVGVGALEGAEEARTGRDQNGGTTTAFPSYAHMPLRGLTVAGTTSQRTYRLEFQPSGVYLVEIKNATNTGVLSVTEIKASVL